MERMDVTPLPAFSDNYLWLLQHQGRAAVVDPGDGEVVLGALRERRLQLHAILITHHHPDHIGGLARLLEQWSVPVYGPRAESGKIAGLSELLDDGARLRVLDEEFEVLAVPGHTLGHIAYFSKGDANRPPRLFCGDTLFSGGCGRLFEGTPEQMYASLTRLKALPPLTEVYCAHEYTLSNLAFAQAAEPDNPALQQAIARVRALRARKLPSVPSTVGAELAFNPFLRCEEPGLAASAARQGGIDARDPVAVFAALRRWKDGFRTAAL
jgi:hydroxyacylglutathione hydrolase